MADGYITIETKLSTNKFDKQITDLEKKIRNEEDKAQLKLKAKLQAEDELERHKQKIFEIEQEYEKTSQQVEHLQSIMSKQSQGISLTPQDFTDLQNYPEINKQNEKLGATLDEAYEKQTKLNNKVEQTSLAYKQTQDNVQGYKTKVESVNLQKQQEQANNIKKGFEGVGKSVQKSIGKIGRMALGLISVASAYSLVSSASSTLKQYDKQYTANIEYIQYLLAQALAPALKFLVNLASTLLSYLNYILNVWFKITLFSKDSAKNFVKGQKSLKGASKSTSKIKKDLQTTPFDEMNVLQDTNKTSGGDTGVTAPSIDPTTIGGEVPDWLKWIVDNKDLILAIMAGITAGLLAWKLGLDGIKALGIGLLIAGIVYTIESLLEYLQDPSWENFGKIIQGIGVAIVGLGILIESVPVAVAGAIVLIVGTIVKYWDQIKNFFQQGIDWMKSKTDDVYNKFGKTIGVIYEYIVFMIQGILDILDGFFSGLKGMFDGLIKMIKGIIQGDWKQAWEGAKDIFNSFIQGIGKMIWGLFETISGFAVAVGTTVGGVIAAAFKAVVNGVLWAIESILNNPIKQINSLIGVINKVPGINLSTLPTFRLPRMKVGGIINMPGKGIPVGGGTAIGGEAGAEGVIPLTDSQAMETLGEAIGRYITINANITNTMNRKSYLKTITTNKK